MIEGIIGCSSARLDEKKQVHAIVQSEKVSYAYLCIKRLYVYTPLTYVKNNMSASPLSR